MLNLNSMEKEHFAGSLKPITFSLVSVCILFVLATGCHTQSEHRTFRGIYADDPAGTEGLYNPERGFRLEVALDVTEKNYVWAPVQYPDITSYLLEESARYASDSVSLVQTYFYLTGAVGKELTEEDFRTMDIFLDALRSLGKKAVLRFAYETQFMGRAATGPTEEDIIRHTEQLAPFLEKNKDVIQVVQAGMIGAWGEWHSSFHGLEQSDDTKRTILEHICRMTPAGRYVQVRVPEYKNLLGSASPEYARTSFHDDFIVVKPHRWDGGMSEGTPAYEQMVCESPYLPVDGELPWGTWSMNQDPDNPEAGWIIDGCQAARRLFVQHYTSLSAIHNYKEKGAPHKYSMMYWKETPVTEAFLKQNHMPVSDGYFYTRSGQPAQRNVFDYIRDHLGYRIELQELTVSPGTDKRERAVELSLINRGFSTLFNEHPVYFVLVNEEGSVAVTVPTDADAHAWQPYQPGDTLCTPLVHTIRTNIRIPDTVAPGNYRLGLWIPDGSERLKNDSRYAVRCANGDTEWWISGDQRYGINLLTTLTVE